MGTARFQPVEKASQSLRPQAQIEFYLFSPAACTSEKILLGSQTCERRASALRRAAAFSNESPTQWVSFESLSKILFSTISIRAVPEWGPRGFSFSRFSVVTIRGRRPRNEDGGTGKEQNGGGSGDGGNNRERFGVSFKNGSR